MCVHFLVQIRLVGEDIREGGQRPSGGLYEYDHSECGPAGVRGSTAVWHGGCDERVLQGPLQSGQSVAAQPTTPHCAQTTLLPIPAQTVPLLPISGPKLVSSYLSSKQMQLFLLKSFSSSGEPSS